MKKVVVEYAIIILNFLLILSCSHNPKSTSTSSQLHYVDQGVVYCNLAVSIVRKFIIQ